MQITHGQSVVVIMTIMLTQEFSISVTASVSILVVRSAKVRLQVKIRSFVKSISKKNKSKMSSFYAKILLLLYVQKM